MAGTDLNIEYIAQLARIELTQDEKDELGQQLKAVIDYMDQLGRVDVTGVEPTSHPFPMDNVTRADEPGVSLTNEEALRNAPSSSNGLFIVPRIVE